MTTTERLSTLDASFLAVEGPDAHMHVGWRATFDSPAGGSRPAFAELRDHIASRLGAAPRYRQRLASVPLGAHRPVWVDDPSFDIRRHVREAPAGDLDELVADVMSEPLHRDRPLWEMWIADAPDGGIAMVGKAHHCMVDGLGAVELTTSLLDIEPDPEHRAIAVEPAEPPPGPLELLELLGATPRRTAGGSSALPRASRCGSASSAGRCARSPTRSRPWPRARRSTAPRRRTASSGGCAVISTSCGRSAARSTSPSTTCCSRRSPARCGTSSATRPRR
jgi:WS/DGAT/MGAT family acyltransferase